MRVTFQVQGSAEQPYDVTVSFDPPANLTATCTCPAGVMHQYCKHRFSVLSGDLTDIVSPNADQVAAVCEWIKGSDVERAMGEVRDLEADLELVKRRLGAAKKLVARAMMD